ncbi:MAG: glycosyltransferase family 4 protein [Verrucomicrobia bacterium]|nr:glycosyltransferase family 4 protein [Verrucomicrobiota bacterium]
MKTPAKIAWISCVGEKGGAEVTMLHTFRVMDRTRFHPVVVQLRPGPLSRELKELEVDNYVLTEHRMRNAWAVAQAIRQIASLAKQHHFALLHSNGFRAHVYGGLGAWKAGIPEVWTGHTAEVPGISTQAILAIPTRQVIANCPRTAQFFEKAGKPTKMIWPGVNTSQLDRGTSRAELAAKYQLPADRHWVSMGARLQRFKGQREFVRAIASLPAAAGIHGIVIGGSLFGQENDYERELRALAVELQVTDRITFTGFIPDADVAGLLGASSLTLHPAHEEDFGLAVAEAQALGVPTIAFATVGPSAIIEEGRTGSLVPIGDQAALNQSLAKAVAHPEQLKELGRAARERSRRLFSIEEHVHQTQEVYSRVLAG